MIVPIILNWNRREDTLECLRSLSVVAYPRFEAVVVDNGSADGSQKMIREEFPNVTLLETGHNVGFAAGNNLGIQHALKNGAEYIMLLNNDTVVARDCLEKLIEASRSHENYSIFGPKILFYDRPELIWSAGSKIDWRRGNCMQIGYGEDDNGQYDTPNEVNAFSGCAIMFRREVAERIGLLDPRFFLYYEETDWCARAKEAGFRMLYVPEAKVYHKVSATMGRNSAEMIYYFVRNRLLFICKRSEFRHRVTGTLYALCETLRTVGSNIFRGKTEEAKVRLKGLFDFYAGNFGEAPLK